MLLELEKEEVEKVVKEELIEEAKIISFSDVVPLIEHHDISLTF